MALVRAVYMILFILCFYWGKYTRSADSHDYFLSNRFLHIFCLKIYIHLYRSGWAYNHYALISSRCKNLITVFALTEFLFVNVYKIIDIDVSINTVTKR